MQLLLNAAGNVVSTVGEIPADYTLTHDSIEIHSILDSIGADHQTHNEAACMFVKTGDGEYLDVWISPYYVPALDNPIRQVQFVR